MFVWLATPVTLWRVVATAASKAAKRVTMATPMMAMVAARVGSTEGSDGGCAAASGRGVSGGLWAGVVLTFWLVSAGASRRRRRQPSPLVARRRWGARP